MLLRVLRDADTAVGDFDAESAVRGCKADGNFAALGRELDRVAQNVLPDLLEQLPVGNDARGGEIDRQLQALAPELRHHRREGAPQLLVEQEGLGQRLSLAALQPRDAQQVVRQAGELRAAFADGTRIGHARLRVERFVAQQLRVAADGRDGRFDLVRNVAGKILAEVFDAPQVVRHPVKRGGQRFDFIIRALFRLLAQRHLGRKIALGHAPGGLRQPDDRTGDGHGERPHRDEADGEHQQRVDQPAQRRLARQRVRMRRMDDAVRAAGRKIRRDVRAPADGDEFAVFKTRERVLRKIGRVRQNIQLIGGTILEDFRHPLEREVFFLLHANGQRGQLLLRGANLTRQPRAADDGRNAAGQKQRGHLDEHDKERPFHAQLKHAKPPPNTPRRRRLRF